MNSPNLLQNILANSQICYYTLLDKTGDFLFANSFFKKNLPLLYIPRSGASFLDLLSGEEKDTFKTFLTAAETPNQAISIRLTLHFSTEISLPIQWDFSLITTNEDDIVCEGVGTPLTGDAQNQPSEAVQSADNPLPFNNNILSENIPGTFSTLLFHQNPLPMWMYEVGSLRFLEVNEMAVAQYGYSKKEFLQMTLLDIRPPEEVPKFKARQLTPVIEKRSNKSIWRHLKKNGEIIDVAITANKIDYNGRVAKLVMAENITEQLLAEEQLMSSNERFTYASRASFDVIWDWDLKTNLCFWGEGYTNLFGYDLPTKFSDISTWYDHIHQDDKQKVTEGIKHAIDSGAVNWTDEYRFMKSDGTTVFVIDRGILIKDEQGKPVRMIGAMHDITNRKINEQQLQKINLQLLRQQKERGLTAQILRSISEKEQLNEAFKDILKKLTLFFNFEIGEVWMLNLDKKRWEMRQKWYTSPEMEKFYSEHPDVISRFREMGIIGTMWLENEIRFIDDLPNFASFQRKKGAIKTGLTKSLGVPILFKGQPIAIFSFFGKKEFIEREKIRVYFESLSIQLGIDIIRKKTEEELNNFFNLSPDILSIAGFDGYLKKINPAFSKILGYDHDDLMSQKLETLIHPEDVASSLEKFAELKDGNNIYVENRYRAKDGSYKWLSWAAVALMEEELIYATAKDITDKKELDQKVNRILESISEGFFTVDKNSKVLYWNNQAEKLLNIKKENVLGKKLEDIFDKQIIQQFSKFYQKAFFSNQPVQLEEYIPVVNKWFEINGYPYEGILSVFFKDVSQRKKSEETIKIYSERYEGLSQATKDAIWDWNLESNVIVWNEGLKTIFNYPDIKHTDGANWRADRIHPEDRLRVLQKLDNHRENKTETWEDEYRFMCADGSYKYILDRGITFYNLYQLPVRMIGSMQDLTETKNNEQILKDLNESLEKRALQLATSNAELESFAYVASHDLQEPLRMVSSFLQLIERKYKSQLDQKAHEYIRFAVDGAERMKGLILDLLEFSRVNTRKEPKETVILNDIANDLLLTYKDLIKEQNGSLEIEPLPDVLGNKVQLMQLFQNLVSNALKYRSEDPPVIKITVTEKTDNFEFAISDNGIGIEPRFFHKIFVIFQRLHNRNEYSGTGIGLAICKKIVELHSGSIWVESQSGQGSTFFFSLSKYPPENK